MTFETTGFFIGNKMAKEERDREDIFREATALVERIELSGFVGQAGPVVVGFRRNGCASIYFGVQLACHFNSRDELRRAYAAEQLLKAKHGHLVTMRRVRMDNQVQLCSRQLTEAELTQFLAQLWQARKNLHEAIVQGLCKVTGQVPADECVLHRVEAWLSSLSVIKVAISPHAR
jgi:hypothetical protein